jgi:hypothetical protein
MVPTSGKGCRVNQRLFGPCPPMQNVGHSSEKVGARIQARETTSEGAGAISASAFLIAPSSRFPAARLRSPLAHR